jgi:hypothetical protein
VQFHCSRCAVVWTVWFAVLLQSCQLHLNCNLRLDGSLEPYFLTNLAFLSIFIKFPIHSCRFRVLLTWLFSKTCSIRSRNVRLGLLNNCHPNQRIVCSRMDKRGLTKPRLWPRLTRAHTILFCQSPFIHPFDRPSRHILVLWFCDVCVNSIISITFLVFV